MKAFRVKYRFRYPRGTLSSGRYVTAATSIEIATNKALRRVHELAKKADPRAYAIFLTSVKELGEFHR